MNNLGEKIKSRREELGLSIEELSEKTMLSVAIIRDLENGAFSRYEGDETYVKMYLRKISSALGLDEDEMTQAYVDLTQQMRQQEIDNQEDQEKKKEEDVQKHKDFQFERPNYNSKSTVYQDKSHLKYVKAVVGVVLVALIVGVVYFGISYTKSSTTSKTYTKTENSTSGNVSTKKKSTKKKATTKKKSTTKKKKTTKKVTFNRLGTMNYQVVVPKGTKKVTLKVVFGARCWVGFTYNGSSSNTSGLKSTIYTKGQTVTADLNVSEFNSLRIRNGNNVGTKYYINNVEVPFTSAEQQMTVTTLSLTKVVK